MNLTMPIITCAVAALVASASISSAQERRVDINKIGGGPARTVIPNSVADRSRGLQYEQRAGDEQKAARNLQNQARIEMKQGNSMAARADMGRARADMAKARSDMSTGIGLVAKSRREH